MNERVFFKGMTYGWGSSRGEYRKDYAVDSLRKLKETGSEWIALSFYTHQEHVFSTEIPFDYGYTVTDRDIEFAVKQAKELGLKVCLKPVVNSKDGIWRAHIGFPPEEGSKVYWDKWFTSYTNFMRHYAELAEELGCEMLCVGCEMVKTETQVAHWTALIEDIRTIYSGKLIYNANHGKEENVEWFHLVDLIGISAYYPVADGPGESAASMLQRWNEIKPKLKRLHERFQKPIVFVEIGCRPARGCAAMPWDFSHTELPFDEDEQANFYQSALQAFWNEEWFSGYFWWDWRAKLYPREEAHLDLDFNVYGKKAETILREWYGKDTRIQQG